MISRARLIAIALVLALIFVPVAGSQSPPGKTSGAQTSTGQAGPAQSAPAGQASKQEPSVRLRTDEVVVDAIVMDKKNRPVMNLTADDFELFEDGVKQRIASFRIESTGQASQVQA